MMKKIVSFLLFFLIVFAAVAQTEQRDYEQEWRAFEGLISVHRVQDAKNKLDKIEQWAIEDQKQDEQFRTQIERAGIFAYYNENKLPDAIFYLDSLLKTAQPPYANVFNFLIAECLSAYMLDNLKVINERTHLENVNLKEFENWSSKSFTQSINNYLINALSHLETTTAMKSENFDFLLLKNSYFRPLRPTLFDAISQFFLQSIISSGNKYHFKELLKEYPQLLQPCPEFLSIDLDSITTHTNSSVRVFFTLFQNLFRYHTNQIVPPTDVIIDYELLKLNYLGNCLDDNNLGEDSQYFKVFETLENQYKNADGYAAIQYQKALYYFELAKNLKMEDAKIYIQQKSRALFEELSLNSSDFYRKNALHFLGILNVKELKSRGRETYYTSAHNLLVPVTYRNLDSIYVSIYRIEPTEFWNRGFSPSRKQTKIDSLFFDYIMYNNNSEYVRTELVYLINPYDFKTHTTDILLQNIKPGNYYLVFHLDKKPEEKNILTCVRTIATLTKINSLGNNRQCNFSAVHCETGKPLPNVKLFLSKELFGFLNPMSTKKTNSDGNAVLNKRNMTKIYNILVQNGEDSYLTAFDQRWGYMRKNLRRTTDSKNIELFTDRAIYRPGQTVYFKAIYYGNHKVLKNRELQIEINDPNRQKVGKFILKTNSFGSVDTCFKIPVNCKTGNFSIFAKAVAVSFRNTAYIEVEEYKRPPLK